ALLLVAREALTNVARHSRADCVELRLELPTDRAAVDGEPVDDSQIRLTVRDDGVGFDPEQAGNGSGFGLHSMAERMAGLGGRLLVDSRPGRGTTVTATCRITAADRPSRQEVDRDRAA
ncbi:MAG: ATP-binding protein, partial [Acidobacteriota bacterium]